MAQIARFSKSKSVPTYGWQLTTSNTGLARLGIVGANLPLYTGSSSPSTGTVISDMRIETGMNLWAGGAGNITFNRCLLRPTTGVTRGMHAYVSYNTANMTSSANPCYFTDCDIDGNGYSAYDICFSCAFAGTAVITRCHIFGTGSGVWLRGANPAASSMTHTYIHGLRAWGDPATTGSHNDGFTCRDYSGPGMVITNNRVACDTVTNDSGACFNQAWAGPINNVLYEYNLFEGGGYNIALEMSGNGYGSNMIARNNRFTPTGYGVGYHTGGVGWADKTGNYRNDPASPPLNQGVACDIG
jgi:hypothetical protein